MRNSVLEELRVRGLADNQEEICCRAVWRLAILESKLRRWKEKKVEYHLHKVGGLEKVRDKSAEWGGSMKQNS